MSRRNIEGATTHEELADAESPASAKASRTEKPVDISGQLPQFRKGEKIVIEASDGRSMTLEVMEQKPGGTYRVKGASGDKTLERDLSPREVTRYYDESVRRKKLGQTFDKLIKAEEKRSGEDDLVVSRIKETREERIKDIVKSDEPDVAAAAMESVDRAKFALGLSIDQTLDVRNYLDTIDAVDSLHAEYLKAEREAKAKKQGSVALDETGTINVKADWAEAKKELKNMGARLNESGVDLSGLDLDRKSSRDMLRNEKLAWRRLGPEEISTTRTFASALDKADLARAKAMQIAKKLKRLNASGERGDEWEAAVQEDDAADNDWKAAKKNVGRLGERLKGMGVDPASPELRTKASRAVLLAELPGEKPSEEEDELDVIDPTAEIRDAIAKDRNSGDIQRMIDALTQEYFKDDPTATTAEIIDRLKREVGEEAMQYTSSRAIELLSKVPQSREQTDAQRRRREKREDEIRRAGSVENAPDAPFGLGMETVVPRETPAQTPEPTVPGRRAGQRDAEGQTLVPAGISGETLAPVREQRSPKPQRPAVGMWSSAKRWGRNILIPLVGLLGLRSVDVERPDVSAPQSRDESAMAASASEKQVAERRIVKKIRSIEDADTYLETLLKFPGKKEYDAMTRQERVAETKAGLEDLKAIRAYLNTTDTAIKASKRISIETKLEPRIKELEAIRDRAEMRKFIREL